MDEEAAVAHVKAQMRDEQAAGKERIKRFRAEIKSLDKEYTRLTKQVDTGPLAKKNLNRELTEKDEALIERWQTIGMRLRNVMGAVNAEQKKLARLDEPDELERRAREYQKQRERFDALRQRNEGVPRPRRARTPRQGGTSPVARARQQSTSSGTRATGENKKKAIEACLAALKEANGKASEAAKILTKNKTPMMSGKVGPWTVRRVRFVASQGGVTVEDDAKEPTARGSKTAPARGTRKRGAAASGGASGASKAGNGNGGNGKDVTPLSKSDQASGKSRAAQASTGRSTKRSSAKTSNAKRKTGNTKRKTGNAKRGNTRRK